MGEEQEIYRCGLNMQNINSVRAIYKNGEFWMSLNSKEQGDYIAKALNFYEKWKGRLEGIEINNLPTGIAGGMEIRLGGSSFITPKTPANPEGMSYNEIMRKMEVEE